MVGPDAGVNYGGILNRDTQVLITFHCVALRIKYSAKSCILLMEHKYPPPLLMFNFCFYAYFRLC